MSDIKVTVEPPSENQIVEVTYDGQEIVQPPFTQAEHLMRQATKLDFSTIPDDLDEDIDDDNDEDTEENNSELQENGTSTNQPTNKWPWESVRDKLRDALAEVSVLSDVLSVATKECGRDHNNTPKKYMMLDGPTMSDQVEQKPYVSLLAKKKSLDGHVAKILLNGAEHLKSIQSENRTGDSGGRNFHFELLKLRQHWRLKKVSNTILGDLSFRTAGSQFKQSGLFEVIKSDQTSEDQTSDQNEPSTTTTTKDSGANSSSKSVLKVNVPAELEGMCYIQVVIQKESEQLISSTNICQNGTFDPALVEDVHWQKKLEQAQNVIFCKELFAQLAKEAIEQQAPVPHMVVGNQIVCALSPDIQLLITLKTSGFQRKRNKLIPDYEHTNGVSSQQIPIAPQPAKQHDHVLEHSLHQLLRKAHLRNLNPESGGLSSSPVGVSKKRRLAGPRAADRRTLLKMASEETFFGTNYFTCPTCGPKIKDYVCFGPDGFRTKRSVDYHSLQYFEFPNKNQCEGQYILKYSSELFFSIWYSSTLLLKIGSLFSLGQYCHCWIRKHTENPIRNSCICQKINLRLQRWESIKF